MKAWQLERPGGALTLEDIAIPEPRTGSVVVRMEASSLMSYMKDYVDGKLPIYHAPEGPFIPGGNGVGVIHAVGSEVWHLKPGQRVVISSHFVAQENVANPAQILIGVTAAGAVAERVQADWRDGTLTEYALLPAASVTPVDDGLDIDPAHLAVSTRYVVPFGGLLRGRLAAGETVIVSGATGAYGTAAVLLAVAMGAARVIAVGRNAAALDALANAGRGRVTPVVVTGDSAADVERIRAAAHGGADMAFDMVGGARDPNMTLAALRSLASGGRLVLMGSMAVPLPLPYTEVMMNSWEILGQFMYPRTAYRRLLALIGAGELDMNEIRPLTFPFHALPDAIEQAAVASSFECVVIEHSE
ncbi:zinc-binding dehydrogenase [Paraburkholderia panacisoli]|uniref:Zinc-binding dehydrogenase n=1 Tax=Paraburkholderia panacisoli TaxID=2603818 RepID=A0A5B0GR54_9BURK|nr:zinc-binding dehydrogenase [Paraburkholderia panacisoli]KAA1005365.1 zinc-binding dehydrogenase [Paraburkholderia panacisoli]